MLKCPYCWEKIQSSAKKCRFCWEWINGSSISPENKSKEIRKIRLENNLLKVSCVMLWIAVIWFGWYGFYLLNRLVIFIIMLILFIKTYRFAPRNEQRSWIFWITAIVYNPFFSIYLTRPIRTVIDIVLIIIFISIIKENKHLSD